MKDLKNKKVLLMGLGILGGGLTTAKWLLKQGADLTVTDMKDEVALAPSLEKLKEFAKEIKYVLGKHEEKDFLENDIIVINPDVPADNKFVKIAREAGKKIENELTLFYKFSKSKQIIAITGTRGKTTTTSWTYHFIKNQNPNTIILGNNPEKPFLQEIENIDQNTQVVMEVPSYHLEIVDESNFKPYIAVITNLYRDHIARHKSMEEYARAKANIFKGQTEEDFLVLDPKNEWTEFFLNLKPKAEVFSSSLETIIDNEILSEEKLKEFGKKWGEHNVQNLVASSLAAFLAGVSPENIQIAIETLPSIKFRQEKVFDNDNLEIYNDTAATSPEATIAALQRFSAQTENLVLISGGTDRELEFKEWAKAIEKYVKPENLILLSGSATEKMKAALSYNPEEHDSLKDCLQSALGKNTDIILFSPSSKSFEKFKNEFDRGEKFNDIVKELN